VPLPMESLRAALATSGHPDVERALREYGL